MANSTVRGALSIHGGNPQFLIEKVIRARIYDSLYWKEHCFALTAESIIDKAIALHAIGGTGDRQTPTPFISLVLKLLQLQPEKEIIIEYLLAEEFKYLRALAAFYVRLTFPSLQVYEILEPLMRDYRKLRVRHPGGYELTTFDVFVDELLTLDRVCEIILPRLTPRKVLEETEGLAPRRSLLEEDDVPRRRSMSRSRSRSRTPDSSPDLRRGRSLSRSSAGSDASRGDRYVSRSPSRSPDRSDDSASGEVGDTRWRYVSRSPSVSPDRIVADPDDGERIEGDV
ncbi:hypothetical protein Q5752_002385 [Cryptotrichosporon argae]